MKVPGWLVMTATTLSVFSLITAALTPTLGDDDDEAIPARFPLVAAVIFAAPAALATTDAWRGWRQRRRNAPRGFEILPAKITSKSAHLPD